MRLGCDWFVRVIGQIGQSSSASFAGALPVGTGFGMQCVRWLMCVIWGFGVDFWLVSELQSWLWLTTPKTGRCCRGPGKVAGLLVKVGLPRRLTLSQEIFSLLVYVKCGCVTMLSVLVNVCLARVADCRW